MIPERVVLKLQDGNEFLAPPQILKDPAFQKGWEFAARGCDISYLPTVDGYQNRARVGNHAQSGDFVPYKKYGVCRLFALEANDLMEVEFEFEVVTRQRAILTEKVEQAKNVLAKAEQALADFEKLHPQAVSSD